MDIVTIEDLSRRLVELAFNSVWQAALIASAVWLALRVYAPSSAAARYRVWATTLGAVVVLPAMLWAFEGGVAGRNLGAASATAAFPNDVLSLSETPIDEFSATATAPLDVRTANGPAADRAITVRLPETLPVDRLSLIALLVALSVGAFRLGRIAVGIAMCRQIRHEAVPVEESVERRLTAWRQVWPFGRIAELHVSGRVRQPMVLGYRTPLVLLPLGFAERLPDEALDHVVLHELAHVRRRDDWAVLAQRVVEAVCAFNPVVGWIGRRLELEREAASDEWVVAVTGQPKSYARSLLKLAELRLAPSGLAIAPAVLTRRSQLSARIDRLLNRARGRRFATAAATTVAAATLALCALFVPIVGLSNARAQLETPKDPSQESAAVAPIRLAELPLNVDTSDWQAYSEASKALDDTGRDDPEARRIASAALGVRPGVAIVMDPQTGRVLTIVNQKWAVGQQFTPASTIKLVTTLAALDAGVFDPEARVAVHGFDKKTISNLNLDEAMAYSNTEYFQHIGERTGLDRFLHTARAVGFGEKTGINISGEAAGTLPEAPTQAEFQEVFGAGTGFGVTPIQLAAFVSAIGNGGRLLEPVLVEPGVQTPAPRVRRDLSAVLPNLRRLLPGMRGSVAYGTGHRASVRDIPLFGKTGTVNLKDGLQLGLFVSCEDSAAPRLAVVVVLIGKGTRGADAAETAGVIYRAYLNGGC